MCACAMCVYAAMWDVSIERTVLALTFTTVSVVSLTLLLLFRFHLNFTIASTSAFKRHFDYDWHQRRWHFSRCDGHVFFVSPSFSFSFAMGNGHLTKWSGVTSPTYTHTSANACATYFRTMPFPQNHNQAVHISRNRLEIRIFESIMCC